MPLGPPVFKKELQNCEIIEGSAARFACQVSGNPEPTVEWYRDGKILKESKQLTFLYDDDDNCRLIITEGGSADAGEYTCVAENRYGKVSSRARLTVDTGTTDEETASEASESEAETDGDDVKIEMKKEKITKYYTVKDELGKGRFGIVCKCIDNKTGREYAAKFIKCSKAQERQDVLHEVEIMSIIRHRRLMRLQDSFESPTEMILVMELVTGGELFEKVVEDEYISENEVVYYMKQILEGVEHMHQLKVLHLDLKPENIMIVRPDSKQIKLIDFGLARRYNPKENLKVMFGTPEFVAPEVITYERISPGTDMWSIGVIAYVLLSGLSPFMGDTDSETLSNVQRVEWDFDDPVFDEITDEAKDFISRLLKGKSADRNTVDQSLKHSWVVTKHKVKKLKTARLKAFTAKRKWKKALTCIRSTNFLSRILGSRGADKKDSGDGGGGGGGLLARVKAMHAAGVQAPSGGPPPASSPFLSPASAVRPRKDDEQVRETGKDADRANDEKPAKEPEKVEEKRKETPGGEGKRKRSETAEEERQIVSNG